jgi:hypothetical protein
MASSAPQRKRFTYDYGVVEIGRRAHVGAKQSRLASE